MVIFLTPLSSNFELEGNPLTTDDDYDNYTNYESTSASEHNEIHNHCHYKYHNCHCHYYNDWNSDKTKKIWKNHGKPIYRLALKTLLKKPFSFGLAYAVKKKW